MAKVNSRSANEPIEEYPFPWPNEDKGYHLFPSELESDPLVLFHGTPRRNLERIVAEGFKAFTPLKSVSYAKCSSYSLAHVCGRRQENQEDDVVIAVRFESLEVKGIENNWSDIHVYLPELQPVILGFCVVPGRYQHI